MSIKAILWDLGDVVVPISCSWPEIVEGVINGLDGVGSLSRAWFEHGGGKELLNNVESGLFTHERFWQEASCAGGISTFDVVMASALFSSYLPLSLNVAHVLVELQKRYPLFAVSDGDFGSEFVVRSLFAHHAVAFKKVFISSKFGLKKPLLFGPVISFLQQKFGVEPEECIFIDNKEGNVIDARNLGMSAFVFNITEGNSILLLLAGLRHAGVKI